MANENGKAAVMRTFRYLVRQSDTAIAAPELDTFGSDGWELATVHEGVLTVAAVPSPIKKTIFIYTFKKETTQPAKHNLPGVKR